jgi:hypothetical protein
MRAQNVQSLRSLFLVILSIKRHIDTLVDCGVTSQTLVIGHRQEDVCANAFKFAPGTANLQDKPMAKNFRCPLQSALAYLISIAFVRFKSDAQPS